MQFAALGHALQVEIANKFVIQSQVKNVKAAVKGWRVGSAGALKGGVGAALRGKAIELNARNAGEIEIISGDIEMEGAGVGIVSGAAGDGGIIVDEMSAIERNLAAGELGVGIESLNGFAVGAGVVEMHLSFAVRIGKSAGGFYGKIGVAGDGMVIACDVQDC